MDLRTVRNALLHAAGLVERADEVVTQAVPIVRKVHAQITETRDAIRRAQREGFEHSEGPLLERCPAVHGTGQPCALERDHASERHVTERGFSW